MFLDLHTHVYKYPYPTPSGFDLFCTPEEVLHRHAEIGVDRAVLLPVVSSEMYMPQSMGEIIELCNQSEGRWLPFCNIDPRIYSNSSDADVGFLIDFYKKQGCLGMGEFMPNLPWLDPRVQNLLHHTEAAGLPLLFDITGRENRSYGIYDDMGLVQLETCLQKFPNLIFIGHGPAFWSEIGTLRKPEDRYGYPHYPIDAEGRVPELLRTYPNLWFDLSAGSGYTAMMRSPEYTVKFLNEFADRAMFGTDICYASQKIKIGELLNGLRETGKLSDSVFEGIAHANAERLLGL